MSPMVSKSPPKLDQHMAFSISGLGIWKRGREVDVSG